MGRVKKSRYPYRFSVDAVKLPAYVRSTQRPLTFGAAHAIPIRDEDRA